MTSHVDLMSALEREAVSAIEALEESRVQLMSEENAKDASGISSLPETEQDTSKKDNSFSTIDEYNDDELFVLASTNFKLEDQNAPFQSDDRADVDAISVVQNLFEAEAEQPVRSIPAVSFANIEAARKLSESEKNSQTDPTLDIAELKQRIENLEAELAIAKTRAIRLSADFENYRKRVLRDQEVSFQQQKTKVIGDFLGVMDNFERAIAHAKQSHDFDNLLQGIELTAKMYLSVLAKHDCQPFDSLGKEFDPHYHEVLQRVTDQSQAHNTIVQEHLRGYTMYGRVLRAALVVVSQHDNDEDKGDMD